MGEEHATAAVALETKLVESPAGILALLLEELKVLVPLVANDLQLGLRDVEIYLAAGEAAHRDDHVIVVKV